MSLRTPCAPLLVAVLAAAASAQTAPAPLDLPTDPATRTRVVGLYSLTPPSGPTLSLRVAEEGDGLVAALNRNGPTRLLFQGGLSFRPEDAPVVLITFGEGASAGGVTVDSPDGEMTGVRVGAADTDPATAGPLFDELAAQDRALFDALFVACDPEAALGLLTADLEFYHDGGGVTVGDAARRSLQDQAESCPREQGVSREVVPGSLAVSPLPGYGAVQTGAHRFVEAGGVTVARFVHLWRETPDGWRVARVVSFDHRPER